MFSSTQADNQEENKMKCVMMWTFNGVKEEVRKCTTTQSLIEIRLSTV